MASLLSSWLAASRYARVLPHLAGDLLDVGCQEGQLRDEAAGRIASYAGLDISEERLERARARHPDCDFFWCDLDAGLPELDRRFDTIVMCAVIEHLFNQKIVFDGLARLLKPGGRIVLTTPTPFGNDVVHALGAKIGLFHPAAQDDHIVIYNRKRFAVLAGETGLALERHELFQLGCNQLAILRKPG